MITQPIDKLKNSQRRLSRVGLGGIYAYVAISAVALRDSIALNAAVLPMLISDMQIVKIHVKMTEFTGTCHLG